MSCARPTRFSTTNLAEPAKLSGLTIAVIWPGGVDETQDNERADEIAGRLVVLLHRAALLIILAGALLVLILLATDLAFAAAVKATGSVLAIAAVVLAVYLLSFPHPNQASTRELEVLAIAGAAGGTLMSQAADLGALPVVAILMGVLVGLIGVVRSSRVSATPRGDDPLFIALMEHVRKTRNRTAPPTPDVPEHDPRLGGQDAPREGRSAP